MNLASAWSFNQNAGLSETYGRTDNESEAPLPSHQFVLFDEKHRNIFFHGVTKHIESMIHRPTAKHSGTEAETWEAEIKLRKQQFGVDAFHIMNQNRQAGSSTGGELEPRLVEIFADAVTDVTFLMEKQHCKQEQLVSVSKLGIKLPAASMTSNNDACDELSGNSSISNTPSYQQQAWGPRLTRWMGIKPKISQQDDEANKLRTELDDLSQAVYDRKRAFGVEIYDAMVSLGEGYRPNDFKVADTLDATKRDIQDLMDKIKEAKMTLENCGSTVSHDELREFVCDHPQIWAMLSVNCQLPEEKCQEVAFRVALELVTGRSGHGALETTITSACFQRFQQFLKDPKGHQEFFQRSVFMAFDDDWNGVLDRIETDKFLDTFYSSGSIFEGDKRLPSQKEDLKKLILEQRQRLNGEQLGDNDFFTLEEIRSLISGIQ